MSRYAVGIDLGTTNSVLAYAPLAGDDPAGEITVLPVEQLIDAGEIGRSPQLPSFTYLPGEHELPAGSARLPWLPEDAPEPDTIVGEFAKRQGARVPGRLISSAKSWLCHNGVDRTAPILPWGGEEVKKLSPVEVSALYLAHLAETFRRQTGHILAEQDVVLCVPASFDEVARELTVQAAQQAGLTRLTLLEEPQAAFYAFVAEKRDRLKEVFAGLRQVLVIDVGGGTTDLTLIEVESDPGAGPEGIKLTRAAVGDHLMLGGDNMDQALARLLEPRLGGAKLDAASWAELCQACRSAKERLLTEDAPASIPVSLLGRGSKLFGGTRRAELSREEARLVVLEGFFPKTPLDEMPKRPRTGLRELGLPYASDPAIPRHIAAFLARHTQTAPDAFLLNGGALWPQMISTRIAEILEAWHGGPVQRLQSASLDLAVARGAAYYALARRGLGLRIGGGAARAYYVGIDVEQEKAALCVIPRRHDSLEELAIPGREFALRVGVPVRFPLYASSADLSHRPGDVVKLDKVADDLVALPPIETALKDEKGAREVPVRLHAQMTEVGTLALSLVSTKGDRRFRLEFNLRGKTPAAPTEEIGVPAARVKEAKEQIEVIFGKKPREVTSRDITGLSRALEKILGKPRDEWPTPLLRELFEPLAQGINQRNRSPDHHATWLNLTGFVLRPGFGYPLDEERLARVSPIFMQGPQHRKEKRSWVEWWIFWRRVAGGLDAAQQQSFFDATMPLLKKKGQKAPEGVDEMLRFLASLERVEPSRKETLGEFLLDRIERSGLSPHLLWALGRVGSRHLFAGGAEWVVSPEVVSSWLERLLDIPWRGAEDAAFAATLMARKTGDRKRDVDPALAQKVAQKLRGGKFAQSWIEMVSQVVTPSAQEERRVFGESLPSGLRLVG